MEKTAQSRFFYCFSPNLHRHLQAAGQRYICAGLNEKTMRKFWQYERSTELDRLLTEWQARKPKK